MEDTPGSASHTGHILTDREIQSLQLAQTIYGAVAKEAAGDFAEALGFDEAARAQFVGEVATRLEDIDFERRRAVAAGFRELTLLLTGEDVAVQQDSTIIREFMLIGSETANGGEVSAPEAEPAARAPQPVGGPAAAAAPNGGGEGESLPDIPLGRHQRSWLAGAIGEENTQLVEALPYVQRTMFFNALGEQYMRLKVRRVTYAGQRERVVQMVGFMRGKTRTEVAEETDMQLSALGARFKALATVIRERISDEDVRACLPSADTAAAASPVVPAAAAAAPEQPEATPEAEKPPLTKEQHNWLTKFLQPETMDRLADLALPQREFLADALSRRLRSYEESRQGSALAERHAGEMTQLLMGQTYEEIARELGLNTSLVKTEMHSVAMHFKTKVPREEIDALLVQAEQVPYD